MGSTNGEYDEKPQHRVMLSQGFWMGETPVTQGLWQEIMGNNPSYFLEGKFLGLFGGKISPDRPVDSVSWYDCQKFVAKLNARSDIQRLGLKFSLPTEAQWEYACRAGTTGDYGGTGKIDDMGWYDGNSGNTTHPVGRKEPNEWGLYDMHGNVWEWCADWYDSGYYAKSPASNPTGPAFGDFRVDRGGSFYGAADDCAAGRRDGSNPGYSSRALGLRLAASGRAAK